MSTSFLSQKMKSFLQARRKKKRFQQKAETHRYHLLKAWLDVRRGAEFGESESRIDSFFFLNDFSEKGMCFFSPVRLEVGESVALNMKISRGVYMKGTVIHCNELPLSENVFAKKTYRYRVQIRLDFANPKEAQAIMRLSQNFETKVFG